MAEAPRDPLHGETAVLVDGLNALKRPLGLLEHLRDVVPPPLQPIVAVVGTGDRKLRPVADLDLGVAQLGSRIAPLESVEPALHGLDGLQWSNRSLHSDALDRHTVGHRNVKALDLAKSERAIQGLAWKRRAQYEVREALIASSPLARLEDRPAKAAPREIAPHEHRSHPRRLAPRIEQAIVVLGIPGPGVELVASAPSTAGNQLAIGLVHEVGAVVDQLHVEMRDMHRGARGLLLVVEAREEVENRDPHQLGDARRVRFHRESLWREGERAHGGL